MAYANEGVNDDTMTLGLPLAMTLEMEMELAMGLSFMFFFCIQLPVGFASLDEAMKLSNTPSFQYIGNGGYLFRASRKKAQEIKENISHIISITQVHKDMKAHELYDLSQSKTVSMHVLRAGNDEDWRWTKSEALNKCVLHEIDEHVLDISCEMPLGMDLVQFIVRQHCVVWLQHWNPARPLNKYASRIVQVCEDKENYLMKAHPLLI